MSEPRVGVIGLGTIGGGLSTALVNAGRAPVVYDVRPEAIAALEGVHPVGSPAEVAAEVDVVFVAVVDADQVRDAVLGDGGVVSSGCDVLVVVLSTIAVDAVRSLAAAAAARGGVRFVDAGVSGAPGAAAAGELVFLAGGPEADVELLRAILRGAAREVLHLGPLGSGLAAKVARNLVTYGTWLVVHEACELADAAGVDRAQLLHAIRLSDPTGAMQLLLADGASAARDAAREAAMTRMAALMEKDLAAASELAASFGLDSPVVDLTRNEAPRMLGLQPRAPDAAAHQSNIEDNT